MQVQADVDESDIGRIKVGQPVRFTVDAYPDELFVGKIHQVRKNSTTTQNVVTYPVIVSVDNPDLNLRPSMTANITIDVATDHNKLRIPNSALRFKPPAAAGGTSPAATAGNASVPGGSPGTGAAGARTGGGEARAGGSGGSGGAAGSWPTDARGLASLNGRPEGRRPTVYPLMADGSLKAARVILITEDNSRRSGGRSQGRRRRRRDS